VIKSIDDEINSEDCEENQIGGEDKSGELVISLITEIIFGGFDSFRFL